MCVRETGRRGLTAEERNQEGETDSPAPQSVSFGVVSPLLERSGKEEVRNERAAQFEQTRTQDPTTTAHTHLLMSCWRLS